MGLCRQSLRGFNGLKFEMLGRSDLNLHVGHKLDHGFVDVSCKFQVCSSTSHLLSTRSRGCVEETPCGTVEPVEAWSYSALGRCLSGSWSQGHCGRACPDHFHWGLQAPLQPEVPHRISLLKLFSVCSWLHGPRFHHLRNHSGTALNGAYTEVGNQLLYLLCEKASRWICFCFAGL